MSKKPKRHKLLLRRRSNVPITMWTWRVPSPSWPFWLLNWRQCVASVVIVEWDVVPNQKNHLRVVFLCLLKYAMLKK